MSVAQEEDSLQLRFPRRAECSLAMPGRTVNSELTTPFSHNDSVVAQDVNTIFLIPQSRQRAFTSPGLSHKKDSFILNYNPAGMKDYSPDLCQVVYEEKFYDGTKIWIYKAD